MLKNEFNPILLSTPHLGGREQLYIQEALTANCVASAGSQIDLFEKEISYYLGKNKHIAALNTGTSAIHLALVLAGVRAGDTVLCQSLTFSASANPILYQGAIPVFIDSETDTWNMCPVYLEKAILSEMEKGQKPKAIVAVHLYGMPFKIDELRSIANKYRIVLIEDSAEALGSFYKGQKCGTFGDFGVLSFNQNKIITTSGGGVLVTTSSKFKDEAIFLATQARDKAPHYQHSQIGYNYRMSAICAAMGRGQMEVLENHINARRAMHDFYKGIFSNISEVTLLHEPSEDFYSNHWLSVILLPNNELRESLKLQLELSNIESRPLWKPMHLQPVFEQYRYYGGKISENLFYRGLCLPSGSNLTDVDRIRIKTCLIDFF